MMPMQFEHEEKMQLVDLLNSNVYIGGKQQYLNNAIGIYCRSIFDSLNDNDVSLIQFYEL